jgi:hypothetical protein
MSVLEPMVASRTLQMRPPPGFVFLHLSVMTHLYTRFCDDKMFLQEHFAFTTLDAISRLARISETCVTQISN